MTPAFLDQSSGLWHLPVSIGTVLIDEVDAEYLSGFTWHWTAPQHSKPFAYRLLASEPKQLLILHRLVAERHGLIAPGSKTKLARIGDVRDCRISNICLSAGNRAKPVKEIKPVFKTLVEAPEPEPLPKIEEISLQPNGKWLVLLRTITETKFLGYFETEDLAVRAHAKGLAKIRDSTLPESY